ncbi:MAG: hypothetical protein ACPG3X_00905 [Opitutales bacterium]
MQVTTELALQPPGAKVARVAVDRNGRHWICRPPIEATRIRLGL